MAILTTIFKLIRGFFCILLLCINFIMIAVLGFLLGFLVWLIPRNTKLSHAGQRFLDIIPFVWYSTNLAILKISTAGKWHFSGDTASLSKTRCYLMIANHQSWMDILVLGCLFRGLTPPLKFFMKKELFWQLPIAGFVCYFLNFPLMSRHSKADIRRNPSLKGKDIETTRKACARLKETPATLINFVEGTRFTKQKHTQQSSPYQHLLKPKAGGIAIVIQELHETLDGIIDVTIRYDADHASFLNLVLGNVRGIHVSFIKRPITPDIVGNYFANREFRPQFQSWLNRIWKQKDQQLEHTL